MKISLAVFTLIASFAATSAVYADAETDQCTSQNTASLEATKVARTSLYSSDIALAKQISSVIETGRARKEPECEIADKVRAVITQGRPQSLKRDN